MNKLESTFFYIVLFFIAIYFIKKVENVYKKRDLLKNSKEKIIIFSLLGIGIPILLSSVRYKVGTDYNNYLDYYTIYSQLSFNEILKYGSEFLFILIIKIAHIFEEPQIMFAITAFLTVFITYKAILNKKEKLSISLMFALYIFLYYMYSLNIIRQALAVAIIFYSYRYILQNDFKKFLLMIIVATLFHTTAILFLPFYFIVPKKNEKNKKIMFIVRIMVILMVLIVTVNFNRTINILSNIEGFNRFIIYNVSKTQGQNKQIIINTIMLFIFILYKKSLKEYDENNKTYLFLYIIGYILTLSGFISPYAKRMALYFNISEIYLLASLPKITKNKEQKNFIVILLIIYIVTMFVLSTYILDIGEILPYQTVFYN